ncbi:MAG: WecB/TagA/CpsF family glycosyltransferase [Natronohydrobacter sp.]|nr:WecB/TagA/CpsF family glycosyltransferase [Natronohydrobacter sp.]
MQFTFGTTRIDVTTPTWEAVIATVGAHLKAQRGFALATINLDHLVKLRSDTAFRAAYARHEMIVADGNPIVWLSRLANRPVDLIPGSDLIHPIAGLAASLDVPVAFFGSRPEVLEEAAKALQNEHPGLTLATRIAPPMGFDPTGPVAERLLKDIAASGAGLCFVALGAPKQEEFAAFGRSIAPQLGFVSIGAGLDFIAGHQTRAPRIVRALALEWLWRMMLAPGRLGLRYLRCILILPGQALAALRLRFGAG